MTPFKGQKGEAYEGGYRVPTVIRWPGKGLRESTATGAWTVTLDSYIGFLASRTLNSRMRRIHLVRFEEAQMWQIKNTVPRISKPALVGLLMTGLLILGSTPVFSGDRVKPETIDATAMGTDTQLGQMVGITVTIYEYSTPEDRQVLVQAFERGQNQGLVNALTKMKAVGHIAITGTLGYDLSFIKMIPTPTGRKIRFITNRLLRFGEVYWDTQSSAFNLTAGEFDLNETDKSKSSGVLYPAAQLVIDKEGQLQFQLNQNAWKLADIIDWKGTPGVD